MTENFFQNLSALDQFVDVTEPSNYAAIPSDWTIIITDVKGSTEAIEAGRYKDVNVVGAASIITAMNAIGDVSFPFVFGGDGSTIVVPDRTVDTVLSALCGLANVSRTSFNLELRVGAVSVKEINDAGHDVLVAKHAASDDLKLAMFWGTGLTEAERLIKNDSNYLVAIESPDEPNTDGLHCRWQPFQSRHGQMVSILVSASTQSDSENSQRYREVIEFVETLRSDTKPVHDKNAKVALSKKMLSAESKLQSRAPSGFSFDKKLLTTTLKTMIAKPAIENGFGLGGLSKDYKKHALANTDFRKFDETLRMVLDLSTEEIDSLRQFLEAMRQEHGIAYGVHASDSALMTCLVFDLDRNHVHFIDGDDGGYAAAAKHLKRQLKRDMNDRKDGGRENRTLFCVAIYLRDYS